MITLNRRYKFSASHRLHVPALSVDANQELFGKCNNPFGHGHNYEMEVSVKGEIHSQTGQAVDLNILDDLVRRNVVARYDHRYLNSELPEFEEAVPTTENLGLAIQRILRDEWPSAFPAGEPQLTAVRIFETERNIFEVASA